MIIQTQNSNVLEYDYVNLGWFSRDAAFEISKHHYVAAYSYCHRIFKPDNSVLPHELRELCYTGRAGGGKQLYRYDFKNGKAIGTRRTNVTERLQKHFTEMARLERGMLKEEKYRWFWDYVQENPGQAWFHLYVPNPQRDLEYMKRQLVPVCSIEMETIKLFYNLNGNAPPMNREHRWDLYELEEDSLSGLHDSTTQTLEQFDFRS